MIWHTIAIFLVLLPSLCLNTSTSSAQDITRNNNVLYRDYKQFFRGSSSHSLKETHKRNHRTRLLHNLNQNRNYHHLSTSLNSSCQPGELAFEISIQSDGNAKMSWSVTSADNTETTQSSPLFVSHASIYNQELCFDEKICHHFKMNGASSSNTSSLQNKDSSGFTSTRISINGFTVLENPRHTLTSFSFKFGQCERSFSKNDDVYYPSACPCPTTIKAIISQSPTPAWSKLRSTHANHKEEEEIQNGEQQDNSDLIFSECFAEIEFLIIIILLSFIIISRISCSSTLCHLAVFVGAIKWFRNYMNPKNENEDKSDDDVHERDNNNDDNDIATNLVESHSMSTHVASNRQNSDEQEDPTDVVQKRGFFSSVRRRLYSTD